MVTLKWKEIVLRALEPSDLDFLYELENDEALWEISNTTTPYSKYILKQYLDNSHQDIYSAKQLRLVITLASDNRALGFVDLFDFDPKHQRVGLGIVIFEDNDRGNGFASQSIEMICSYAFTHLNIHQLYANITGDNKRSIEVFTKLGFLRTGIKKDWIYSDGEFKDEHLFQLTKDVL
ncbi:MAG: diamine N-acetyltransferase [Sediminicola sp.]|jgi:diamine N-acetyltransferase|tara:strand:+ start:2623 stop:3156 length:534 start_codon:yes stop_codon:yes gene_type:complete